MPKFARRALAFAALVLLSGAASAADRPRHVFVIVLENKGFEQTFGDAPGSPYLGRILPRRGQLLRQYYGTGHASLDNYISMVSGQGPNLETQTDCQIFSAFLPGVMVAGQAVGQGCVYPAHVKTIGDQMDDAGLTWKAYAEDLDDGTTHACRHPAPNRLDPTQSATADNQYAARHEPFVYFRSIIDDPARCEAHVVDLHDLRRDLKRVPTTPNLVFITPDLCSDGHDATCADGGPGGYEGIDAFLRTWVPRITGSPAFRKDGLLVITFDEADLENPTDPDAASACCGEKPGFNTLLAGLYGPGGGRPGALLISPSVAPGTVNDTPYNHYSLLRSLEDIFGLPYLGFAAEPGLSAFGDDVFGAP